MTLKFAALALGIVSASSQLSASPAVPPLCQGIPLPTACTYMDQTDPSNPVEISASGTNPCWARLNLRKELNAHGVVAAPDEIHCVFDDEIAPQD
jgi:hypothetical protein